LVLIEKRVLRRVVTARMHRIVPLQIRTYGILVEIVRGFVNRGTAFLKFPWGGSVEYGIFLRWKTVDDIRKQPI
jgi:hypothetical protein